MIQYKRFVLNFVQVNTYLLWDETKEACLIDPGFMTEDERNSFNIFMEDNGLTLKRCLCTHNHFDHTLGGKFIIDEYGIEVEMPQGEISTMPDLATQLKSFGIPGGADAFEYKFAPLRLTDDNTITFGNTTLQVLEVPGHSPAHVAFYDERDKLVLVGDLLFKDGMGRYDLWGGDYATIMESIRRILKELPDETKVLSGHGPETTIGAEKRNFI